MTDDEQGCSGSRQDGSLSTRHLRQQWRARRVHHLSMTRPAQSIVIIERLPSQAVVGGMRRPQASCGLVIDFRGSARRRSCTAERDGLRKGCRGLLTSESFFERGRSGFGQTKREPRSWRSRSAKARPAREGQGSVRSRVRPRVGSHCRSRNAAIWFREPRAFPFA